MEHDYVTATYVVMGLAYGLSTVTLFRQAWGGKPANPVPRSRVIPFPERRTRLVEHGPLVRAG
jgi:hypothetical protein